ncbi:MAG TPA: polyprenol monophosphomannose synthase [Bacteroidales bacterium]|nr:polyprenol monophosphomannose synthase [Bacteroidales bacterium]
MPNIVIIPTFKEKENIEELIRSISSLPVPFDILIIDDNSPDGTAAIVKNIQPSYPNVHLIERPEKLGLGTAYIAGFKWSLGKGYTYIYEMDADFSHDPRDLVRLHKACTEEGADVAIGSRYISGVNVVNWPLTRVLMSYFASIYVRLVTGMKVMDTTAGFVCYKKEVLESIKPEHIKSVGYSFQIEMKFTAYKLGYRIVEIPIIFTDRRLGTSKMSGGIFNEALWGVLGMKLRSFFIRYRRNQVEPPLPLRGISPKGEKIH